MLTESQVRRFARQLILEPVGQAGQEKLVNSGVRIFGEGLALETAAAYLGRGGTHLETSGFQGPPQGFGFGHADASALATNTFGVLGTVASGFTGAAPWVAVGELGNRWRVLYRGEKGCARCFVNALNGLVVGTFGPKAVRWGALAGWQYQRVLLGLDTGLGGRVQVDDSVEALSPFSAWQCDRHPGR